MEQPRVSVHVVYPEHFDTLSGKTLAEGQCLRIAFGTRLVRDRFEEGLPTVSEE